MHDPPVKTVRKFLYLLEHSDADFEEELGEQHMFIDHQIPRNSRNHLVLLSRKRELLAGRII